MTDLATLHGQSFHFPLKEPAEVIMWPHFSVDGLFGSPVCHAL